LNVERVLLAIIEYQGIVYRRPGLQIAMVEEISEWHGVLDTRDDWEQQEMSLWAWEVCCASANSEAKKERREALEVVQPRVLRRLGNMRTHPGLTFRTVMNVR
jgi:hypothetical protein